MKLFVIGVTGRTGREIVEQALARGHQMSCSIFACSNEYSSARSAFLSRLLRSLRYSGGLE
jgi:putative NADH-flavin reductase